MNLKTLHLALLLLLYIQVIQAQINRPSGINLAATDYYSTEFVFTDCFKQSREWIVHNQGTNNPWTSGLTIPVNENGYPLEIPYDDGVNPPQTVRTLIFSNSVNHYPSGLYRLIVSGSGQVRLWGGGNGTYQTPIDVLVPIDASIDRIVLEIDESLAEDPITDIKLIQPDYVDNYESQQFTNEILEFLSNFQSIRFMDWLETNFSEIISWDERTKKEYFTQTKHEGVAWEYIIDLCNASQKDAWINIPHRADDNYINQLAILFRDHLDDNLKVYLEYSNEIWNYGFLQFHEVANFGEALGYTGQAGERSRKYTAKRSADIFYEFENVFNDNSRLVKVIPGRAAGGGVSNSILQFFNDPIYNPNQVTADALAIAPYFGNGIGNYIGDNDLSETITISEILDLTEDALLGSYERMDVNKIVADNYGLELIAYEAGQHLVATGPNRSDEVLTAKLIEANGTEEMGDMYCDYFNYWYDVTQGGMFSIFSSHRLNSRFGSWGIKERMDEDSTPKYDAVVDCVFSYNTLGVNSFEVPKVSVFPNPTTGSFNIEADFNIDRIELYDLSGKKLMVKNSQMVTIENLDSGVYLLKIVSGDMKFIKKIIKN